MEICYTGAGGAADERTWSRGECEFELWGEEEMKGMESEEVFEGVRGGVHVEIYCHAVSHFIVFSQWQR